VTLRLASLVILLSITANLVWAQANDSSQPPPATAPQAASPTVGPTAVAPASGEAKPETVFTYCTRLGSTVAHGSALANACTFALTLFIRIPNYLCREEILSTIRTPMSSRTTQLTFEVSMQDGKDSYSDLKVNGTEVKGGLSDFAPQYAANEFGSMLANIFAPETHVEFEFEKETQHHDEPAFVFKFTAPHSNTRSLWAVRLGESVVYPSYHGHLWVDAKQLRPLRIEMDGSDFGESSPIKSTTSDMNYGRVPLGDGTSFVLPTHFWFETCTMSHSCIRNVVTYSQCHKFRANSRIINNIDHP
jgi:hypothetical protein